MISHLTTRLQSQTTKQALSTSPTKVSTIKNSSSLSNIHFEGKIESPIDSLPNEIHTIQKHHCQDINIDKTYQMDVYLSQDVIQHQGTESRLLFACGIFQFHV
jgi:hypothetical protein